MAYANNAENITAKLLSVLYSAIPKANFVNRYRIPEVGTDALDFMGKFGRAVVFKLRTDEFNAQTSSEQHRTYRYDARVYVQTTQKEQTQLTDFYEEVKHTLHQNQSPSDETWDNVTVVSGDFGDQEESGVKIIDFDLEVLKRVGLT